MLHRDGWVFNADKGIQTFQQPIYKPSKEDMLEAYLKTLTADAVLDENKGHDVRLLSRKEYFTQARDRGHSLVGLLSYRLERRAFAVSEYGFFCLVPAQARVHDLIALVQGSELPFVLRPSQGRVRFSIIGQAYVHGIMDGEVWSLVQDGSMPLEEVSII